MSYATPTPNPYAVVTAPPARPVSGGIEVSAGKDEAGTAWFSLQNCSRILWEGTLRLFDHKPPQHLDPMGKGTRIKGVYRLRLAPGEMFDWHRNEDVTPDEAVPPHRPGVREYGPDCPIQYGDDQSRL